MGDAPLTRPSLLLRTRDARDAMAWSAFVDRYGPLVYHVDGSDLTRLLLVLGKRRKDLGYLDFLDFDGNGKIGGEDLMASLKRQKLRTQFAR